MKKISVILPTYNEAGNIVQLIKAINQQIKKLKLAPEIIVIDDNSQDGTADEVLKLIKKLPVKLFKRKKRGLATAIHLGIKKSSGEIIILMDTDFNHKPKDVSRLLKPILKNKADLVIGSRYIKDGGMHRSEAGTIQFLGSKYGSLFVSKILLNLPVKESLSGFLAFKKLILNNLNQKAIFQGYGEYCIRLLYRTMKNNYKLTEIPVIYGKRRYGQSKSRLFRMMIDYFFAAMKLRINDIIPSGNAI